MSPHASPNGITGEDDPMPWSAPFEHLSLGQLFRSGERTVRDTDVIVFSALTGDWHPQHCDPEWAARSPFGERIAHGMLTLSLAVGLLPLDPQRVLALRRLADAVFKRPVRLNESIYVAGEIVSLAPVDDHAGLVGFSWAIRNQDDALVCRARVEVLWRTAAEDPRQEARLHWHDAITQAASGSEFVPIPL